MSYESINSTPGISPYVQHTGDRYFVKTLIGYRPAAGPDGQISDGALTVSIPFKMRRGERVTVRTYQYSDGSTRQEAIPGWGTVAANLTMTVDFIKDAALVLNQPETSAIFWIDDDGEVVDILRASDL